jgi:hypothetical protein
MSIYAVLSRTDNPALEARILELFPNDHYKYSPAQWFISSQGTAKELSDKIGISDKEQNLSAVILSISHYWGRASTDLWDWMKSRWE